MNKCLNVDAIAIIGAACRFPGNAHTLESFWNLMAAGTDAVTRVPADRFSPERFSTKAQNVKGRSYTLCAGIIEHSKEFDPEFFGISRKEGANIDPQQRMALEMAWEALECAGILPSSLAGSMTGVFMGASNMDQATQASDDPAISTPYSMTGSTLGVIANRISYILDLHGPSLVIDTACSSSLVAVHAACEALRSGGISLAFAGGVNSLFMPFPFIGFSQARMLSPDGRCKVFDASGNGYVRSEGGGVILLKRLKEALADGDVILGIVAGSGVNSDGRTTGISLPNAKAQAALIEDVYARFSLDKREVAYVEAHGTGTAVGDPIETAAIGKALGAPLRGFRRLPVGSAKGNIGHLEPAAGMAGLIKSLLVLRHGEIPPNLHLKNPNPEIDFEELNISVPAAATPLPGIGGKELISINSFGFGGTNGHVVLRRAPAAMGAPGSGRSSGFSAAASSVPFLLTARSRESLAALARSYAELPVLQDGSDPAAPRDIAATLAFHREALGYRALVRGVSAGELRRRLNRLAAAEKPEAIVEAVGENVGGVFAFSGNGSQWVGMGRALLADCPEFRNSLEEMDGLLRPLQKWSLVDALIHPDRYGEKLERTEYSQPLLFAMQAAVAKFLIARGIRPSGVIGHSVGEAAAAYICGGLSLPDAVRVIHFRSTLQERLRDQGIMAVANVSEAVAEELLGPYGGNVEIAAVNTPDSLTLAGDAEAIKKVLAACKKRRIGAKALQLPYPFHTRRMESIREELLAALAPIKAKAPDIPFYATALPDADRRRLPDAEYWWLNIRHAVRFHDGIIAALEDGNRIFLEIGPNPILRSYLRDTFRKENIRARVLHSLTKEADTAARLEEVWQEAWLNGWKLDAKAFFPEPFVRRDLPVYPWNREYCWVENTVECRGFFKQPRIHPLLGWSQNQHPGVFENTLHLADAPWLADHVAGSTTPFPAAAFVEMMLAASARLHDRQRHELERLTIFRPLQLAKDAARVLRLSVDREDGGLLLEARPHLSKEPFAAYAKTRIVPVAETPAPAPFSVAAPENFGQKVSKESLYATADHFLLHYGPAFQGVRTAWIKTHPVHPEILARFEEPHPDSADGMLIPPTLLDGAFQTLFPLLGVTSAANANVAYLPASFERIVLYRPGVPRFAHTRLERVSPRSVVASFRLLGEEGDVLLELHNGRFRRASWLENEKAASRPYVMKLARSPHPAAPAEVSDSIVEILNNVASAAFADAQTDSSRAQSLPLHPYMLLHLASVSAIHESMLEITKQHSFSAGFTLENLRTAGVVAPEQEAWLHFQLETLQKAQLAVETDGFWQIAPQGERPSATMLWRTIVGNAPGYLPEFALLGRIMRHTRAILSGGLETAKALPERLANYYYQHSLALAPFTHALVQCVKAAIGAHRKEDPFRVLQLARDNQEMLRRLFPEVKKTFCRYVVAEKNQGEAERLSLAFDSTQRVEFASVDLLQPPAERLGKYHLIISAFSLHDYTNSRLALKGCRSLLAPGGVLCLVEHAPSAFTDFAFGVNPAWWEASLETHLPVSRFQPRKAWYNLLQESGFIHIEEAGRKENASSPAFMLLARVPAEKSEQPSNSKFVPLAATARDTGDIADNEAPPEPETPLWLLVTAASEAPNAEVSAVLAAKTRQKLLEAGQEAEIFALPFQNDENDGILPEFWNKFLAKARRPLEVLYLAGYDTRRELSSAELETLQFQAVNGAAALAKSWEAFRPKARIWLVAGGALAAPKPRYRPVPSQGGLWGFGRVCMNEMRHLDLRLLDLHGETANVSAMMLELLHPTRDREVLLTDKRRYVPQLSAISRLDKPRPGVRESEDVPVPQGAALQGAVLTFDTPGRVQNLYWKAMPVPTPGNHQVCIAVKSVGMNFRDVMWSMGMLQDEALENGFSGPGMGIECAGEIVAVGGKVKEWAVGDEVLAFAPSCFSTHVLTTPAAVTRKPENLSFVEAATIPVTFMTAWYAIKHLANMQPGERILIHGAAGGVGLAAIQISVHLGLEVYATAGSAEKHDLLHQLGVRHVLSSRSLAFASQIMALTNGEGVDAVLNSLAGEAIPAGISVLRPFGRFLELGKRDFYADSPLRLRPFSNNINFYGIDIDQLLICRPALAQSLFTELMALFATRHLVPLPFTRFSGACTVEAFQTMQQSAHIGKIVVTLEDLAVENHAIPASAVVPRLKKDATYLITGGTGGFGLAGAARLAKRGARHLVLASRNGVTDPEAENIVRQMRDAGAQVVVARLDVGDAAAVEDLILRQLRDLPPLAGIIHAAAALDDGLITGLTPKRLRDALRAKSVGAWNLHAATRDLPLDFFVLYSSATTVFGNPGQSAYVAANSMLETLAAYRRSLNLPAQVIGWGPIADTGMLVRNPKARQMLHSVLGITALSSAEALNWLETCITEQVDASHYFGLDWHTRADLSALVSARFVRLRPGRKSSQTDVSPLERLRACPPKEGLAVLTDILREEIAAILGMPADRLAADTQIAAQGMDSLMAVELGLALEQKFELTGFTFAVTEKTRIADLADLLYPLIIGGPRTKEETEQTEQVSQLEALTAKHAVRLSSDQQQAVLSSIKKDSHDH